jgi:hypothetical protein
MNSLQLYQQPTALAEIPNRDKEIAFALSTPLFSSLPKNEAYNVMKAAITKSYLLAKFECPIGSELQLITDETMKVFQSRFGTIRQSEIEVCFIRGVMGDYGKYMGLALPSFSQFAIGYLKEESRIKLTTKVEEKKEPSLEQRFETAKNLSLKTFDDFNEGKSIELQGATVYRFLAKLGIIKYTDEEQSEFMTGARNEVIAKKGREKFLTVDKHLRAKIERELKDVGLLDEKIKFTAQHNGLVQYFELLTFESIEPKTELTNLINEQGKQYLK